MRHCFLNLVNTIIIYCKMENGHKVTVDYVKNTNKVKS